MKIMKHLAEESTQQKIFLLWENHSIANKTVEQQTVIVKYIMFKFVNLITPDTQEQMSHTDEVVISSESCEP